MSFNPVWELVEPYLIQSGLYRVPDPTYGRYTLPAHPPHLPLIDDPDVTSKYRRIFLPPYSDFRTYNEAYDSTKIIHAEDVQLTTEEIISGVKRGGRWVCYSTWEIRDEPESGWEAGGRGRGKDIVVVHGLGDYGLRYTPHVHHFLKAGFRVMIPDLPSQDLLQGKDQRKVFLCGASMGGWTVLYYLLKYPPTSSSSHVASQVSASDNSLPPEGSGKGYHNLERPSEEEKARIHVAGAYVLCPMVEVSKESRPSKLIENIGRVIKSVAGPLPFAKGVRGNVSDDPRVEEDFDSDREINVPIRLVHGNKDRATTHIGTLKLFDRLPNEDKEIEIFDGYEHVMLKVGIDAKDDEKRQRVLADWRSWLLQRC
ncbi:uncharacterized protein IL334_004141 [Kwoniella shivajii]|uniref:Lysophospholipase n=1 Tax=Kwoniella shivajii TaxID=564305 RepID=A0ABZ1D196_9TREE|nr:hypothetical protein IL334_004141 [Kwoniella shivajii]